MEDHESDRDCPAKNHDSRKSGYVFCMPAAKNHAEKGYVFCMPISAHSVLLSNLYPGCSQAALREPCACIKNILPHMGSLCSNRIGMVFCFGHAFTERGREASWYAFQRKALERGGKDTAKIRTKPPKRNGDAFSPYHLLHSGAVLDHGLDFIVQRLPGDAEKPGGFGLVAFALFHGLLNQTFFQ